MVTSCPSRTLGSGASGAGETGRSKAASARTQGPFASCDWLNCLNGGPWTPGTPGTLVTGNPPPQSAPPEGCRRAGGSPLPTPVPQPPAPAPVEMSRDRKPHTSPISLPRLIRSQSSRIQRPTKMPKFLRIRRGRR